MQIRLQNTHLSFQPNQEQLHPEDNSSLPHWGRNWVEAALLHIPGPLSSPRVRAIPTGGALWYRDVNDLSTPYNSGPQNGPTF